MDTTYLICIMDTDDMVVTPTNCYEYQIWYESWGKGEVIGIETPYRAAFCDDLTTHQLLQLHLIAEFFTRQETHYAKN